MRTILTIAILFAALINIARADGAAPSPPAAISVPAGWKAVATPPPHGDQIGLQAVVLPGTGFGQNITVFQIPAHGWSLPKFVSDRTASLAQIGTVVASRAEKLCDAKYDGWYVDYKLTLGATSTEMEQTIATDGKAFYMATYSRAAVQPEDANGRKALDTLCIAVPPQ